MMIARCVVKHPVRCFIISLQTPPQSISWHDPLHCAEIYDEPELCGQDSEGGAGTGKSAFYVEIVSDIMSERSRN